MGKEVRTTKVLAPQDTLHTRWLALACYIIPCNLRVNLPHAEIRPGCGLVAQF